MIEIFQEFRYEDTGNVEKMTFDALEFWTDAGQEIITPGFQFRLSEVPKIARKLVKREDIEDIVHHEWQITTGNKPRRAADGVLIRALIKRTCGKRIAREIGFWLFIAELLRIIVLYIAVRAFGMMRKR